MIQNKENFKIETSNLPSSKFKLNEEDLPHVFNILRNNLYSNKILAVIREYSSNAWDAHIENDCDDRPIVVHVPTVLEPVWYVRDYGKGLSEEDIFGLYSSYGRSTKRDTNRTVGTLGMGCKSGFAYSPVFRVTSWHGGKKSVYEAYIDESKVGTIAKIHEESSDEPTGLMVTINVDAKDVNEFVSTCAIYFQYFSPMPEFLGASTQTRSRMQSVSTVYSSEFGRVYEHEYYSRRMFVRMGNISYPVTQDLVDKYLDWLPLRRTLILDVPMGSVSFVTSREQLEYTEQTIATIDERLEKLKLDYTKDLRNRLEQAASPWEALAMYSTLDGYDQKAIGYQLVWHGKQLDTRFYNSAGTTVYALNWSRSIWRKSEHPHLNNVVWIVNDKGFPSHETSSRRQEINATAKATHTGCICYYVNGLKEQVQAFLESQELEGATVYKMSEVFPKKPARKKTEQKKGNVFVWQQTDFGIHSTNWKEEGIPEDPFVYTYLYKFQPTSFGANGCYTDMKRFLKAAHLKHPDLKLYGIKPKAAVPENAVNVKDWIQTELQKIMDNPTFNEYYKKQCTAAQVASMYHYQDLLRWLNTDAFRQSKVAELSQLAKNYHQACVFHDADQFCYESKMIADYAHGNEAVRQHFQALKTEALKIAEDIRIALERIYDTYPLLPAANNEKAAHEYICAMHAWHKIQAKNTVTAL